MINDLQKVTKYDEDDLEYQDDKYDGDYDDISYSQFISI